MSKILVVGGGLFGRIAADWALRAGHKVTVFDASLPGAASPAAGCVMKPSWLTSISSERIVTALHVLNTLYGVEDLLLRTNLGVSVKAQRVDPDKILTPPDVAEKVVALGDGWLRTESGVTHKGVVLVAAGIWSKMLCPSMPDINGLVGASARFRPRQLSEARIDVYAPYRQAVAFNLNKNTVWFGDGTAIKQHRWELGPRLKASEERAAKFDLRKGQWRVGVRPYVEGYKAGYFQRVGEKVWVSTGGAKNGVTLAAAQAFEFVEAIK